MLLIDYKSLLAILGNTNSGGSENTALGTHSSGVQLWHWISKIREPCKCRRIVTFTMPGQGACGRRCKCVLLSGRQTSSIFSGPCRRDTKGPHSFQSLGVNLKWWPSTATDDCHPYFNHREQLSTQQNCILWGLKVIIPPLYRSWSLEELHRKHPGKYNEGISKQLFLVAMAWQRHWTEGSRLWLLSDGTEPATTSKTIEILQNLFAAYRLPKEVYCCRISAIHDSKWH